MNDSLKYTFIFGGGAVRGISYVGVVKALEELGVHSDTIAGSSVGAIFAVLYAMGFTYNEMKEIFLDFSFNMFKDINFSFNSGFAFSKGEVFLDWIRDLIEKKYYGKDYKKGENPPVKFIDIEKDIFILTCDLKNNTPVIFSKNNTPEFEVAMAARISASFPGLMNPTDYNDSILVDGDLIKSWPLWKTECELNKDNSRILEFRLEGCRDIATIKNPLDYFNIVFSSFSNYCTENVITLYNNNDKYDYILIDTKDVLLIDFSLSEEKRLELIKTGYETTLYYFRNLLVEKKEKLIPHYNKILDDLIKIKNMIQSNKILDAKCRLLELMVNMHHSLPFIDTTIHERIDEFKDKLCSDIKTSFFGIYKLNDSVTNVKMLAGIIEKLHARHTELISYIKKEQ